MDTLPRPARPRRPALAAALALLLALPAWPGAAAAHAFPDHSEPRVGATVSPAPPRVRIWFDAELEPAFCTLRVENGDRLRVDRGDGRVSPDDGRVLEVSLSAVPTGTYRVVWSVVARDGHRTDGDFPFRVK